MPTSALMKTIEEMLRNLSRPEVLEFGLVSNRLPSVNIGGKFEPVDDKAPSTDAVLEMLVTMGGSRYVESLSAKPTQWTSRLDGVGVIAIAAIMREKVVQARFTVARREPAVGQRPSVSQIPAVESRAPAPPPPPAVAPPPVAPAAASPVSLPAVEGRASVKLPSVEARAPAVVPGAPAVERKPGEAKKQTFSRAVPGAPAVEKKHDSDTNVMAQRPAAQPARASQGMPSVAARPSAAAMPAVSPQPPPPPPPPPSVPVPIQPVPMQAAEAPAFGDDDDNEPTVQTFAPSASSLRTSPEALQAAQAALAAQAAPPAPPPAPAAVAVPPPQPAAAAASPAIQPIQLPPVVAKGPAAAPAAAPVQSAQVPADTEDIPRPKPARSREAVAQNAPAAAPAAAPATKPATPAPPPAAAAQAPAQAAPPAPPAQPSGAPPAPPPAQAAPAAAVPPAPGSSPQVPGPHHAPTREIGRVTTGTAQSLQAHRAGAPPAPPPPPAAGPKRIDTPTGFVLVENPPPARRPSMPPEPAPPPAPPPAPAATAIASAPPPRVEAVQLPAQPPVWDAWDAPTETGQVSESQTLVAPPLSEQERAANRPASIPASPVPAREVAPSVRAPASSDASSAASSDGGGADAAPLTPANVGSAGPAPSGQIPSTDLAQNFGTLDPIGDDPSVERAVIVALPKQGNVDVDELLAKAKAERATDLHLVGGRPPMARIGGELRPIADPAPTELVAGVADSLLPASAAPHFRRDGAVMFVVEHQSAGRLRVHLARSRGSTHVSIRFIPSNTALGALELPERAISVSRVPHGLVLVTSPKGHGATTTAAAIVDAINESSARRVVVIDAPVEFVHPRKRSLITHVDVGVHSRTFASAVASAVKADADVICIGNIEDTSTMRIALGAAEEGRLVIATMHAKSTGRALERIVESFPVQEQPLARATLASTLRLVLGQRLVPSADRTKLFAAHEVMPESIALYTIIRDAKWSLLPTLLAKGKPLGVVRLEEALAELVQQGEVPVDLARPVALSPQDFDALVGGSRTGKKG